MARAGSDLSQYIKKLNNLHRGQIRVFIDEYIYKNRNWILVFIKQRLYQKGQSGDGSILPPYSPIYKKFKQSKGGRQTPTSLFLTGAWYKSMFVSIDSVRYNHIITVKTRPEQADKTRALKRKYGASILTLMPNEQKQIADQLAEQVQERIDKELESGIKIEFF